MDNHSKLIKQLSDLYLIQRGHYLIQYKEPIGYRQYLAGQFINSKKVKSLMDWQFDKHFQGEFTVGTFGGKIMTKFMSFDVDFHDPQMAKWITYKITNTLDELNIFNHYVSSSAGKGFHVDIFFENLIQIDYAQKFFNYVITNSDIIKYSDDANKVEFRPTSKMGIKLPLGYHQRTGNYCGFCLVEDGLKVMNKLESEEYLFGINKINSSMILDILGIEKKVKYDKEDYVRLEDAISPHRPLDNYEQSEDYSIERGQELLLNGLKVQGSRHNSILLIGLYLRYSGLDIQQIKDELYVWMDWQKINTYTTDIKSCCDDIDSTIDDIFLKNYNLSANTRDMTVSFNEIKWIISKCPDKSQKLITYAMLIHSKRHATSKGVFYMPYPHIAEATGLSSATAFRQVEKLIKLGVVEIIDRNRKPSGGGLSKKLPNLYSIKFDDFIDDLEPLNVGMFVTDKTDNLDSCLKFYFNNLELKELLPRRHFESLVV